MRQVKLILIGAGNRGQAYAQYIAKNPQLAKIISVAEPRKYQRELIARSHHIADDKIFEDWEKIAKQATFADAVIIATQDNMHSAPAIAFARKGYHILLEKPMATSESECRQIIATVEKTGIIFSVCHVLRYTPFTKKLKSLIGSKIIGEIVNIQHLEPVGYWHQAHSYVRGNWRKESESSFMLMTKSCHDLDWLRYIMGSKCLSVASFGGLNHFRKEKAPQGASNRCLTCSLIHSCPYSAKNVYLKFAEQGKKNWPNDILSDDTSFAGIMKALETGPYGRCVYHCDNDVVDNQVVIMQFEGNKTASFTMTGFNKMAFRKTRIFGTLGELYGDGEMIEYYNFLNDKTETISVDIPKDPLLSGHGGGDDGLMKSFLTAILDHNPQQELSTLRETLESYLMVFAAERSRKHKKVIDLNF